LIPRSTFNLPGVKFDRATFDTTTELYPTCDSTDPNLSSFHKMSNRLILWHGRIVCCARALCFTEVLLTAVPTRSGKGSRRPTRQRTTARNRLGWKGRTIAAGFALVAGLLVWAAAARQLAPASNTPRNRFDTIIVLGYPADNDGNPTPVQLARVTEAVHEYERGIAARLIVTGAGVSNRFVEAQVMAKTLEAQGVPASAVIIEPNARDTIQNACYATRMMKAHGWNSAEVVSSPSHLPRAALILSQLPISWRTHAAPALQPESAFNEAAQSVLETIKTMRYLVWARWREQCDR
jgi:uncharacterized SAM-binding protein YcdF (DUF218 family)